MSNSAPSRKTINFSNPLTGATCAHRQQPTKPASTAELREAILRSPTVMNSPTFRVFFETLLANTEVVKAFHTCQPASPQDRLHANWPGSTGLQSSEQASGRARTSPMIWSAEREVAAVAAFVTGLGLYMLHQSGLWRQARPEPRLALHWAQEYREANLEDPLRALRRREPAHAGLMAEVLELPVRGDPSDPDQLARVLSAVRLATLPTQATWLTDCSGAG